MTIKMKKKAENLVFNRPSAVLTRFFQNAVSGGPETRSEALPLLF